MTSSTSLPNGRRRREVATFGVYKGARLGKDLVAHREKACTSSAVATGVLGIATPFSWVPELLRCLKGTIKGAWGMKLRRWLVQGLGLACLVLGGMLLSGGVVSLTARSAYAQAPTVSSIVVQGNQRVEADTIRSYFRPGPTGHLDAFQIDEGVKALISTGLFQEVRPTVQGGRLTITVIENPVINRIAFEGNKKVKDEQLKSEIQSKE